MKESNYLKRNKRIRLTFIFLITGSLFLVWAIDRLFFSEPSVFMNNYRYQITVSNGTIQLIIGIGFIIGGIIQFRIRNDIVKQKKEKRKNWLKHY